MGLCRVKKSAPCESATRLYTSSFDHGSHAWICSVGYEQLRVAMLDAEDLDARSFQGKVCVLQSVAWGRRVKAKPLASPAAGIGPLQGQGTPEMSMIGTDVSRTVL